MPARPGPQPGSPISVCRRLPLTSSGATGSPVPMPTLGGTAPESKPPAEQELALVQPSTIALLTPTVASAPIAVALIRLPGLTFAPTPRAVLNLPVVFP